MKLKNDLVVEEHYKFTYNKNRTGSAIITVNRDSSILLQHIKTPQQVQNKAK